MLEDIIRKVVPHRIRTTVGVWAINQFSHSWPLLKAYMTILRGKPPENMGLTKRYCYYDYNGRRILAPRNATGVFMEVFLDEVYEQIWKPEPGDIVLDIGAYVGMFTVKAALAVGVGGRVVAVEPNSESYGMLIGNCRGLNNVKLVRKAVMARNGIGRLYYSKAAGADNLIAHQGNYVDVETITLDRLASELQLPHIGFIKLDTVGAELDVLKGGIETLKRGTRLAIAVFHTTPDGRRSLEQVIALLNREGYVVRQSRGLRSYLYAEKA